MDRKILIRHENEGGKKVQVSRLDKLIDAQTVNGVCPISSEIKILFPSIGGHC